jgi:hypothetical protein
MVETFLKSKETGRRRGERGGPSRAAEPAGGAAAGSVKTPWWFSIDQSN